MDPKIICIYGTSCAGKSTLAQSLFQHLNEGWELIDRDLVIELREQKLIEYLKGQGSTEDPWKLRNKFRHDFASIEDHADEHLVAELEHALSQGKRAIIDTQLPLLALNRAETLRVLVYAPLEALIERDNQRLQRLNRPVQRQYYARAFLFETFASLYDLETNKREESELDTVSILSLKEEISPFLKIASIEKFFGPHLHSTLPFYLYPKGLPDLIIKSHVQTVEESVKLLSDFCLMR